MARRPTPRQRRARALILATLVTLIALAVQAVASGDGRNIELRQVSYLDEVRPIVQRSTEQGADVRVVREMAGDLGRPGIRRRLDRVVKEASESLVAVERVNPPPGFGRAHSLLVSALTLRQRGATSAARGMIDALGPEAVAPIVDRLAETGRDLVAADAAYRAFQDLALARVGRDRPAVAPASLWITDTDQWQSPELTAFVNILKANSSLAPVVDVATLLVRTEPSAVGRDAGRLVLPKLNGVRISVVVANVGNVPQKQVTVVATMQSSAGDDTARGFVDLSPGQRRTMSFRRLRAAPGDAVLTVTISPLEGETSTVDNTKTETFIIRG